MAVEIPKEIFDFYVQSQIANMRHSNAVARDILSLLNKADLEIINKIQNATDGTFSKRRLEAVLKEIRKINNRTYAEAYNEMESGMLAFASHSAEVAGALLSTQLPVGFNVFSITKQQIAAIVSETPIRVGINSAMLLDETFKVLLDGKNKAVMGAIRLGMVSGESSHEITRRLKGTAAAQYRDGILEGGRRDMFNLAHTVVQHTNNQAALATYRANSDVLNGFVDVATFDSRTCLFCMSKSGQTFPLEGQGPTWHIGCRCFTIPLVKSFKELGIDAPEFDAGSRASKSGVVSADLSFNDWLKGENKATQVDLLGPKRAELFRSGGLTLDKFTDASGKTYTLDALKEKHSSSFKKAFGS